MHSAISNTTSVPFYENVFDSPVPDCTFLRSYNRAHVEQSLYRKSPLTFIDIPTFLDRLESEAARGAVTNALEADLAAITIYNLITWFGNEEDWTSKMSLLSHYQAQLSYEYIEFNNMGEPYYDDVQQYHNMEITASTLLIVQGSEKHCDALCDAK